VSLFTDEPAYPVLHRGKLLFPINRCRTTLCTPELSFALERGHVVEVHRVAVYEGAIAFREYVEFFWERRLEAKARGDAVHDELYKKLPNSFYGKWGQRGRVYYDAGPVDYTDARQWLEYDVDTKRTIKHRALGGLHQMFHDEGESRESMPAIAAHITSAGRIELYRIQLDAGREHVLYCDTDSLDLTAAGYEHVQHRVDPGALGALKLESVNPWREYFGPKDYRDDKISKTKGVRSSAHWVGPNDIVQEQWSSLLGLIAAGDLSAPTTRWVHKHLNRIYGKGLVSPSGRVLPYSLG
jgi:hypothetical protein